MSVKLKVVIINKSDRTGGAAVVSARLMHALRDAGVDARMIVAEKLTDSLAVTLAAPKMIMKESFLAERFKIFIVNGFNRETLFKIDTASDGVNLSRHPWVKEADVICLNWINQGLLSLQGIRKILNMGKPVVWTMHDMWCFTGICHHAGECSGYFEQCGECPLLGAKGGSDDLSHKTLVRKNLLYHSGKNHIHFVAVSNWLASLAKKSFLLRNDSLSVIPNAFPIDEKIEKAYLELKNKRRIRPVLIFGAARLDDPVKGFPILIEATKALTRLDPELAERAEIVTFGAIRNPELFNQIAIKHTHLGILRGEGEVKRAYDSADIVVSSSLYETLPGTLVEGQARGCIPVCFNRGGQPDIVEHLSTGYIADWNGDIQLAGENLAHGIIWASSQSVDIRIKMLQSVIEKFSSITIAKKYISLFNKLLNK